MLIVDGQPVVRVAPVVLGQHGRRRGSAEGYEVVGSEPRLPHLLVVIRVAHAGRHIEPVRDVPRQVGEQTGRLRLLQTIDKDGREQAVRTRTHRNTVAVGQSADRDGRGRRSGRSVHARTAAIVVRAARARTAEDVLLEIGQARDEVEAVPRGVELKLLVENLGLDVLVPLLRAEHDPIRDAAAFELRQSRDRSERPAIVEVEREVHVELVVLRTR